MMGYASRTGTLRNLASLRAAGWRLLLTPQASTLPEGFGTRFAIDNGAWGAYRKGEPFDEAAFLKLVDRYGAMADFVVVPDIVAGGRKSLEFSEKWLPRLRGLRQLLLPLQDGMNVQEVSGVLRQRLNLGLFLGGSTEWKLQTMYAWGVLACSTRRYYHVARVNTARRIRLAAEARADSFDGTSVSRYACTLPLLEAAKQQPSLLVPSTW